ncbi:potassium voltage-gated channel subfamily E member 3 [Lissotriton helveticus]
MRLASDGAAVRGADRRTDCGGGGGRESSAAGRSLHAGGTGRSSRFHHLGRLFSLHLWAAFRGGMEPGKSVESLYENLNYILKALNKTLNGLPCQTEETLNHTRTAGHDPSHKDDYSYMYILFVMFLFAVTVGSLIMGYTRSRKVDKRSDPYHVYIKNRISII